MRESERSEVSYREREEVCKRERERERVIVIVKEIDRGERGICKREREEAC